MSKFNRANKVSNSRKRSVRIVKKLELQTEQNIEGEIETLLNRGVLRKSKYHKKLQSDVNKTIGE